MRLEDLESLLDRHAGSWRKAMDIPNFVADFGVETRTLRVQLLGAPNARPIAIAVQMSPEEGGLLSSSELYASSIWKELMPHSDRPPLCVWVMLMKRLVAVDDDEFREPTLHQVEFDHFESY